MLRLAIVSLLATLLTACASMGATLPTSTLLAMPAPAVPDLEPEPRVAAEETDTPPAGEPLRPHPIVDADGRLYALLDEPVPQGPHDFTYHSSAIGVDVDVAEGEPVEGHEHVTVVAEHERSCVARVARRVVVRAHVYDPDTDSHHATPPRAALELEGCGAEPHGLSELAFAIEGKHPDARVAEPRETGFLRDGDAAAEAARLPAEALPPHLEMRSLAYRRFSHGRLEEVTAFTYNPVTGVDRSTLLFEDGEQVALPAGIGFEGSRQLIASGQRLMVWTEWPHRIRFARIEDRALHLEHDLEVMISLDHYAADDCCDC